MLQESLIWWLIRKVKVKTSLKVPQTFLTYLIVTYAQSCLTFCDPTNCSPSGFSDHGIPQVRILEWVAISFSSISSQPRDGTQVSCIAARFFTVWATRETQMQTQMPREIYQGKTPTVFSNIIIY